MGKTARKKIKPEQLELEQLQAGFTAEGQVVPGLHWVSFCPAPAPARVEKLGEPSQPLKELSCPFPSQSQNKQQVKMPLGDYLDLYKVIRNLHGQGSSSCLMPALIPMPQHAASPRLRPLPLKTRGRWYLLTQPWGRSQLALTHNCGILQSLQAAPRDHVGTCCFSAPGSLSLRSRAEGCSSQSQCCK